MTRVRELAVACLALCIASCACSDLKRAMPYSGSDLARVVAKAEAQAGLWEIDITPPPGLGMFGHGPEARIAQGTLLRLRCHAFVFVGAKTAQEPSPQALAFVPCELAAPSLLLQRKVAKIVRDRQVPLGADRIWIAATHTHAAPGHYFAHDSYSGPTSGRRIGFDEAYVDFLAERIASAVVEAYRRLQPARWAWTKQDVFGLSKNRAYPAFVRNRVLPGQLVSQQSGDHDDVTQRAIDPQLSLLRIDQRPTPGGEFVPAGALLVFGLHPTVIGHENPLYGGDAFGYAERVLAHALEKRHARRVLVALANGIEGDATPVRTDDTVAEARRIGAELAERALALWNSAEASGVPALDAQASVRSAYRDLDFAGAQLSCGGRLCPVPEFGAPGAGGADDHPTFMRVIEPFNPGVHAREPRGCQGAKFPIHNLGSACAGKSFPRYAPVSVALIGNGLLIALPAEVTTVAGMRIRDAARMVLASDAQQEPVIAVVGLTNEYLQYVATADEYALQRYEGASTLYGPLTAEFLREQSQCLVRQLRGLEHGCQSQQAEINRPINVRYTPPMAIGWWRRVKKDRAQGRMVLSRPRMSWSDDGAPVLTSTLSGLYPGDVTDPDAFAVAVWRGSERVADAQGTSLATRWDDVAREWRVIWSPDLTSATALCGARLNMVVKARGKSVSSDPATLECARAARRAGP